MKNKERISILESEISRLKVANRTTNERLEAIEGKLGIEPPKPPCSAITDALQEMGNLMVTVERRKVKPEAPEASANNGVSDNPIKPDYTHLLPEGYEFCSEADAEKWVKVEMMPESILSTCKQYKVGQTLNTSKCCEAFKPYYRPIRPIQYKVTTHEIITAVPDPYMPDWSKAPEGAVAHAWDEDGTGYWYAINPSACRFHNKCSESNLLLPPDLDWKQSLRVKPN